MKLDAKSTIETGKAILGIELGSTRIKAVLIDQENKPIAQGSHTWENQLVDGLWTYSIEAIWSGLQDCYADLRTNVKNAYGIEIETLVKAKGFADCLCFLQSGRADLTVMTSGDALTAAQVAQIRDIVLSKSSVTAQNITVVEVK